MNSKKLKYVLFPKPHLYHLLFLIFFICSIIKQTILKDFKGKDNLSIPTFKLYIYEIGDFISLIPYLLIRKKTKSEIINNNDLNKVKSKEEIKYIYNDKNKKVFKNNLKSIILNLFLISLFDFLAKISTVTYYFIKEKQNFDVKQANLNSVLIFFVIFLFLFSRLILKAEFYKHHIFSFIIFIICLIVLIALDFIEIYDNNSDSLFMSYIFLFVKIFAVFLYSIVNVFSKIMFLYYYFSPYSLLLTKAIIQFFYLIIFSLPLCFIKFKNEEGEEMLIFSMIPSIFENKLYIFLYILYLINSFFYNILNLIIIDIFSPNHTAISNILENFGILIINVIQKDIKTDYYLIIRFIMFIILIIASFIYNEFLVINICGLGNDTKLFLDYKEKHDLSLIEEINENDDITIIDNSSDEIKMEMKKSHKIIFLYKIFHKYNI